jgi:hypothetical protein
MSRLIGFLIGVLWLVFAYMAFRSSAEGWAQGHSDLGFWWAVIGSFLGIAALTALVGTARYRYRGPRK